MLIESSSLCPPDDVLLRPSLVRRLSTLRSLRIQLLFAHLFRLQSVVANALPSWIAGILFSSYHLLESLPMSLLLADAFLLLTLPARKPHKRYRQAYAIAYGVPFFMFLLRFPLCFVTKDALDAFVTSAFLAALHQLGALAIILTIIGKVGCGKIEKKANLRPRCIYLLLCCIAITSHATWLIAALIADRVVAFIVDVPVIQSLQGFMLAVIYVIFINTGEKPKLSYGTERQPTIIRDPSLVKVFAAV